MEKNYSKFENLTMQYKKNVKYGISNKDLLKLNNYTIFTINQWKEFYSSNNLNRFDGYPIWAWFKNNTINSDFQNAFLSEPSNFHTHVLWFSKETLNNIVHERRTSNVIIRQWKRLNKLPPVS